MRHPETYKVTPTNGPRPAGKPDECFYCNEPVGGEHKVSCVLRIRTVVVLTSIRHVVEVPESFDASTINFCRNQSSSCQSNIIQELANLEDELNKKDMCMCGRIESVYVGEAEEDDEFDVEIEVLN